MKKNTIVILLIVAAFGGYPVFGQTWKDMNDSTREYYTRANYDAALRGAHAAVQLAEKEFGKKHANYAFSVNVVGLVYYNMGRYAEAESVYQELRNIYKTTQGDTGSGYAFSLNNLAMVCTQTGRYSEAESLYKATARIYGTSLGKNHPYYATALNNLAKLYGWLQRYADAEPLDSELVNICRLTQGDTSAAYESSLNDLAQADWKTGRFDEAESLYKTVARIDEKALGKNHPRYAADLNNLGVLYDDRGRITEAESLYKEALIILRELPGENSQDIVNCLRNLASIYKTMGRYAEAGPLLREGISIQKTIIGDTSAAYANLVCDLANICVQTQCYAEAESLYKEAMNIQKKDFEEHPLNYGTILTNLAILYREMERFAEAESLFNKALNIHKKISDDTSANYAFTARSLGTFYEVTGKYTEAEAFYKEAMNIWKKKFGEHHPDYANSLNDLALLYREMGRYAEAEPLINDAIHIRKETLGEHHPDYARSLGDLALLYSDMGRYADAESLYNETITLQKTAVGERHPAYATSMNNLASVYERMGLYADAESLYKEAITIQNDQPGGSRIAYSTMLHNLALFYEEYMGRYADAESLYKEAITILKKELGETHPSYAIMENNLALLYLNMGRYADAEPLFTTGLETQMNIFRTFFPSLSEKEKEEYYRRLKAGFEIFTSLALLRAARHPAVLDSLYAFRLSTKGILQQATTKLRENIFRSGDSLLQETYRTWKLKKDYLAKLYTMSTEEVEKRHVNPDSLEVMLNDLEQELGRRSELFARSSGEIPITPVDVRRALSADEAAIELIRFRLQDKRLTDTVYYAALILRGGRQEHPEMITLENGNDLETRYLEAYRASVSVHGKDLAALDRGVARDDGDDSLPASEDLYAQYWKKIQEKLSGIKRVYLSVDGVYNQINLGTLYNPETKKYLFEELDIRLLTNTRELAKKKNVSPLKAGTTAELFGYPNYDLGFDRQELLAAEYHQDDETRGGDVSNAAADGLKSIEFSSLPGTKTEVEQVSSLLKKSGWTVGVHLADSALEEAVKAVKNPRVLMLSTHGFFLEDLNTDGREGAMLMGMQSERVAGNPLLRSGLIFAGANRTLRQAGGRSQNAQIDNGILTAYEAMNLNLDGTELVVLSACETGRGEIANGEGVYGLQRAFEVAGAKSILMSLWSVSDEATQQLMSAFYKNWLSGMDKHDALKRAQQEVREKFPQPYFWGAFVMVGE